MTTNLYEFPSTANANATLVNLAYANGFLPETYLAALTPLFDRFRVVSNHMRPMWQPAVAPDTLTHWRQFGADLLVQLEPLSSQPVIGIGHSVGAVATLYAAAMRPDRFKALILLEPTLLPGRYLRGLRLLRLLRQESRRKMVIGALNRGRHWDSAEAAYVYFRGKRLFTRFSDDAVRVYSDSIITSDPDGGVSLVFSPEWEARIYQTVPTDVWRLPKQIKIPTLVIRGGLSDTFFAESAAQFSRLNPRAKIITFDDAGHLIAQERPKQVGQAIIEFLKSLD